MKSHYTLIFIIISTLFANFSFAESATRHLTDVRSWAAPDHTRVVLDVSSPIYYSFSEKQEPGKFSIWLNKTRNKTGKSKFSVYDSVIKYFAVKQYKRKKLKVTFYLRSSSRKNAVPHVFSLKKTPSKPYRIVLDFPNPNVKVSSLLAPVNSEKVIVVDPGHGGEDPGAIGRYRHAKEKDVVLKISRRICDEVNKIPGYRAVLTRRGDYFIPLYKRVRLAERYGADLFISVHANASRKRRVSGASVYYLSQRGASNKAAAILARAENNSDIVGGVPRTASSTLNAILLNIAQTDSIIKSRDFGSILLANINKSRKGRKKMLKYAAFAVLKSPTIPSVLLETAYISNKEDEKHLTNSGFQKRYGRIVAKSVASYFKTFMKKPSAARTAAKKFFYHRVKKGDTIWRISKRYAVSIKTIIAKNRLKSSHIFVGQKLRIPK